MGADGPLRDRLVELLAEPVAGAGFDLEDVAILPAGRRRRLRVVIDSDDGVSLDDIAVVSRRLSAALDDGDVMGVTAYVLEVTSPGVDRPLTLPAHWRRAAGRLVTFEVSGSAETTGRIVSADDGAVVVDVGNEHRSFDYAAIGQGTIRLEFTSRRGDDGDDSREA